MKKAYYLVIVFAGLMMSCGSDDIDDLTDINIPINIEEDIEIDAKGQNDLMYSKEKTFKLEDLGQITNSNIANVETVTVDKITYLVSDFDVTQDGFSFNFSVEIFDAGGNSMFTAKVENTNISSIAGKEQTLNFSQAEANAVSAYLKAGNEIKVVTKGAVDDAPVKFNLNVKLEGTAVLDVI